MVASPWPPETALSLGSPRVKAAMKVLGILPSDIASPKDRTLFPDGQAGEIRHEAHEKKRRQLMNSVKEIAHDKSLDITKSASTPDLGAGGAGCASDATNRFLADVLAKEQISMDKMQKKANHDVQKIVLEEMAIKTAVAARAVKLEEHRKRKAELKKVLDEKLKEQKKEMEKKAERSKEVRRKAAQLVEQECQQLANELQEKDARVQATLDARQQKWDQHAIDMQEAREKEYIRIENWKSGEWEGREKMYNGILEKYQGSEDRLAELTEQLRAHAASKSDRTNGVIAKAKAHLGGAQAKKDEAYLERIKVHDKKKEVRTANAIERKKEFEQNNKKVRQTWEKNYANALKERETRLEYRSPRMLKSMSENYTTKPAWLTPASEEAFETHKTMAELRQWNLQHLSRADHHKHSQQIAKIADMRLRVKALKDSRDEAQYRRFDMIKNVSIAKHHLEHKVTKIRDAPPEKMNGLLEQMGLPPIRTGKEEGEEDEAKK